MRKNIGWQEIIDGVKWEIRILFMPGGALRWRRVNRSMEFWEDFEPDAGQWATAVKRMRARYARRQAPFKDLQNVERLAKAAGVEVEGGYKGTDGGRR